MDYSDNKNVIEMTKINIAHSGHRTTAEELYNKRVARANKYHDEREASIKKEYRQDCRVYGGAIIIVLSTILYVVAILVVNSVLSDKIENKEKFKSDYANCISSFGNSTGILYPYVCVSENCVIRGDYGEQYCYNGNEDSKLKLTFIIGGTILGAMIVVLWIHVACAIRKKN